MPCIAGTSPRCTATPTTSSATITPRRTPPSATFLAALTNLRRFEERARPADGEGASTFRVWLFQIARNEVAERAPRARGGAGRADSLEAAARSPTRSTSRRTRSGATRRARRGAPSGGCPATAAGRWSCGSSTRCRRPRSPACSAGRRARCGCSSIARCGASRATSVSDRTASDDLTAWPVGRDAARSRRSITDRYLDSLLAAARERRLPTPLRRPTALGRRGRARRRTRLATRPAAASIRRSGSRSASPLRLAEVGGLDAAAGRRRRRGRRLAARRTSPPPAHGSRAVAAGDGRRLDAAPIAGRCLIGGALASAALSLAGAWCWRRGRPPLTDGPRRPAARRSARGASTPAARRRWRGRLD